MIESSHDASRFKSLIPLAGREMAKWRRLDPTRAPMTEKILRVARDSVKMAVESMKTVMKRSLSAL